MISSLGILVKVSVAKELKFPISRAMLAPGTSFSFHGGQEDVFYTFELVRKIHGRSPCVASALLLLRLKMSFLEVESSFRKYQWPPDGK